MRNSCPKTLQIKRNNLQFSINNFILCLILLTFFAADKNFLYAQPSVGLSDAYWDFGTIKTGTVLVKTLIFVNKGTVPLTVKTRSSCECVKLNYSAFEIEPAEKRKLKISFDTTGYSGKKTEYVFIDTNDPQNKHLTWLIEGNISGKMFKSSAAKIESAAAADKPGAVFAPVVLKLFYAPNCRFCIKLKQKIIPGIAARLKIDIETQEFLLNDPKNYETFLATEKELHNENNKLPAVVIGLKILGGMSRIESQLEKEISLLSRAAGQARQIPPVKSAALTPEDIKNKIDSFSLLSIGAVGLVDGINPCAFAAIVFLIAYLTTVQKKSRAEIFWTGVTFISGAFTIYFLIGLGLSKALMAAGLNNSVSRIIYGIAAFVTLGLSYYSFSDFFAVKAIERGEKAKVVLRLPAYFRGKIYSTVEKFGKLKYLAPFGFLLGAAVSSLEFFCTGQIYLPTIMYMVSTGLFRAKAMLFLSIYCFMFVFPLIIIFTAMFFGLKSEKIEEISHRHISTAKLASGIVFLALSIFMFLIILF